MRRMRRAGKELLMLAAGMTHQAMCGIFLGVGAEVENGILLERGRNLLINAE